MSTADMPATIKVIPLNRAATMPRLAKSTNANGQTK